MSTKKKSHLSNASAYLEDLAGPLTLASLLEALRLGEEVSQTAFAKRLKISRSHLCDIEKGRKAVSPGRAAEFAKILKLSPTQFVRLALQAELERAGLDMRVSIEVA